MSFSSSVRRSQSARSLSMSLVWMPMPASLAATSAPILPPPAIITWRVCAHCLPSRVVTRRTESGVVTRNSVSPTAIRVSPDGALTISRR